MGGGNASAGAVDGGIFLKGIIVGRTRKTLENGCQYTYIVDMGYGVTRVSVWGEHEFIPLNTRIERRVEIRPYVSRKNMPMYRIAFPNHVLNDGEEPF